MDIYQASDGGVYQLDRHLREYDTLTNLYEDVLSVTGITPDNILLFMQDGKEVKQETLEDIWRQPGPSALQAAPRIELYLYNRESFWSDPEQWSLQFNEDVQLPPPMDASFTPDLTHVQHPFLVAHDHLLHLQSLYQAQSHALAIAYDNLSHHLQPIIREFQTFAVQAEKELREEEDLIKGAQVDMALLPKLVVNSALVRRKSSDSEELKPKTLADYVNPRKMESVRESCRVTYEEHVERFNDLANQMDELALQSEAEKRAFEEKSEAVGRDFAEGIARLEVAIGQLQQLIGSGVKDVDQDFIELDQAMRDDLIALTGVKNDFTLDVHIHLRQVANFQSRLTALVAPLTQLDADLRAKGAFPHLHRLRLLPFAYATAIAEVCRRKEYGRALLDWSELFVDAIARFTSLEKVRREQVQADVLSQLPWNLPPFENATTPLVNLSVMTGAETFGGVVFGYEEVEKLVTWVKELKQDQDILTAMEEADEGHLEALQTNVESLLGQVSFATEELDKMIERSVLLTRRQAHSAATSQTLAISSQLRAANRERAEQAQLLSELEAKHADQVKGLEEQHEQRLASLQTRQAELQDEMVRLRTDLGEEMLARQALSAELEERARDQEDRTRDHEDQSDLVIALQAELAQEKDRATDLGVRLQEALLDVDGLKSAEQTLIAQLQELQEERTRSLQSLGEAELAERNLESQLAGLRAELEATTDQLSKARYDRDIALKNQSAEAERLMRDHIAETDGDRAVLEHQNLTLTKQLEDVKVEMEEKLSAAKNVAIRQADGLKAELSLTRAQLRDVQRKEAVLAGELAMAQDSATAMSQERSYQSDVSRDAVALAARYHETCHRLLNAINASTTISGTAGSQIRSRSPASAPVASGNNQILNAVTHSVGALSTTSKESPDHMRESVLVRSLATASGFDLVAFAEAVQRTINLVKKWSKSCKQYRDVARNKISFTSFTKGDLALFLPTRNAAARSWAAFNLSAPHNFLKVTDAMQEQMKTREWIVARIVETEEAVATGGDAPTTNPYGLADGLRYWTHHVEEYNPSSAVIQPRPSRRSTSIGISVNPDRNDRDRDISASQTQMQNSVYRSPTNLEPTSTADLMIESRPETSTLGKGGARSQSGYFPPMSSLRERVIGPAGSEVVHLQSDGMQEGSTTAVPATSELQVSPATKAPAPLSTNRERDDSNSPPPDIARTPIHPSTLNPKFSSLPPPTAAATATASSAKDIPRRVSAHQRMSSRNSGLIPSSPARVGTSADRESPMGLMARPSSVASSGGSYPKPISIGPKGIPAPAMATTSSSSPGVEDPTGAVGMPIRQSQLRKKSSTLSMSTSASPDGGMPVAQISSRRSSVAPTPSSSGIGASPLSRTQVATMNAEDSENKLDGFAHLGNRSGPSTGPATSSAGTSTASKLIRGFSIGRMRGSAIPLPPTQKNGVDQTVRRPSKGGKDKEEKPSAMDMLRRFEGGGPQ